MQILIKGPAGEGFLALERRQKRVVFKNCIFILSSNFTFFASFLQDEKEYTLFTTTKSNKIFIIFLTASMLWCFSVLEVGNLF